MVMFLALISSPLLCDLVAFLVPRNGFSIVVTSNGDHMTWSQGGAADVSCGGGDANSV